MKRAAVALLLALAGCGAGVTSSDEQVQNTAATLIRACQRRQPQSAERLLTEPAREAFLDAGSAPSACAQVMGGAPAPVSHPHANGDFATVAVGGRTLELQRSRGTWAVAGPRR